MIVPTPTSNLLVDCQIFFGAVFLIRLGPPPPPPCLIGVGLGDCVNAQVEFISRLPDIFLVPLS